MLSWVGTQQQQVPAFSAVKHHGRKLYQLARHEKENLPELPTREVTFYRITDLRIKRDLVEQKLSVSFQASCSSGTYIRSLADDIGQQLGVGATLTALRRLKIGGYTVENAVMPEKVTTSLLLSNI